MAALHLSHPPGGLGDTLTDQFGFHVRLCDLADGFDWLQRGVFLRFSPFILPLMWTNRNIAGLYRFYSEMVEQMAYVPKFTKVHSLKERLGFEQDFRQGS